MEIKDLILADRLAVENSLMANERTLLSFFRTSIVFFATGLSILSIKYLSEISYLGWFFIIISPVLLLTGMYRYGIVKKRIYKIINEYS